MSPSLKSLVVLAVMVSGAVGCRKMGGEYYDTQIGAAVGEAMAGLDESIQGMVTAAARPRVPILRIPDELRGPAWRRALDGVGDAILPSAHAASCWAATFSPCSDGVRTRTFDHCTLGGATLDGSATLSFNRPDLCLVVTEGDAVARTAAFTLTGRYGGTLAVTSPGGGQTVTKTAAGFEYSVGGMQRVLTGPAGRKLFDVSTRTIAPIAVTGGSRANLVMVSGALAISHNLADYTVTLVPQNLTWNTRCNCAVSGSLTGTVAGGAFDGKMASVELTGCGQANVTIDGDTESIALDRCVAL